jgi:hypothetical protein
MRRSIVVLPLLLAACVRPQVQPEVAQPATPITPPAARQLIGLTPQELVGHFGAPALQVHEGSSLKLQFRGRTCVLDAYLYPSQNNGTMRVTYVDTRASSGVDMDQAACISALDNPS